MFIVVLLVVISTLGKPSATIEVQAPTASTAAGEADEPAAVDAANPDVSMDGYN